MTGLNADSRKCRKCNLSFEHVKNFKIKRKKLQKQTEKNRNLFEKEEANAN